MQAQYTDLKPDLEALAGRALPHEDPRANINAGHLCAGGTTERKDTCQGDSGGPIMAAKSDGLIYLAGVTSWGYGCAYYPTPGVYTRVPAYARAIDDVIKGRSTELKRVPEAGGTAVLGDSGEQTRGGGWSVQRWMVGALGNASQTPANG